MAAAEMRDRWPAADLSPWRANMGKQCCLALQAGLLGARSWQFEATMGEEAIDAAASTGWAWDQRQCNWCN